ncbi:MAG: hypothetical protein ABFR90_04945 [Planctomycetota bacterium]
MTANPLIRRYRFSQFRPQQLVIFGVLYGCVLSLLLFINISIYRFGDAFNSSNTLYDSLFIQFTIMQILMMWLLMPMNCSSAIQKEISEKSFDFFRMLPIPAYHKATGILVGRNLFNLIIAGINFIFCVVFGILAELPPALLIQLLLLLICFSLALNFASLLSSILSFKKARSNVLALVLLAIFGFGPVMGGLFEAVDNGDIQAFKVHFITIEVPILYLISAYVLVAAVWFFVGVLRRFSFEYQSLCSRKGAIFLMITYLFLLYGIFHHFLFDASELARYHQPEPFYIFYILGLFPLALIPLFSMRTFDQYVEITRTSKCQNGLLLRQFLHSNLFLGIILFALWALVMNVLCVLTKNPVFEYATFSLLLLTCYLVVVCLVELYTLYVSESGKIGYLLGFIAGLYFILPLIFSAIFENDYVALFSPFGLIAQFGDRMSPIEWFPVVVWNMVILLPLGLLVGRKYLQIDRVRSEIETSNG